MKYQIEKGITMPSQGALNLKYPFREMEVGDSVLVSKKDAQGARNSATEVQRKMPGRKFATRTCEEGLRIWRTA